MRTKFILKLLVLGFVVRVLFTLIHPQIYLVSDSIGYNEAGISLLTDGELRVKGVVSASRPPMYPYFLALVYYLFGHSFLIVRLVQGFIGALTAVVVYKIGEAVFERKVGILAGIIFALYPASWAMGDTLMTEILFTLLLTLSVYLMLRIPQGGNPWAIWGAGMFSGAAALTRTSFFPFLPIVFLGLVLLHWREPKMVSRFALVVLIFLMTIFPWMLRNHYVIGVFTMNPKSGADFYMYNHSGLPYIIQNYEDTRLFYDKEMYNWDEVTKGRFGSKAAISWIKEHPGLFLLKGVRMIMNIWGFDRDYLYNVISGVYGRDPRWLIALIALLTGVGFVIIAPLAIAGFFISKPLQGNNQILTLVIFSLHLLTFIVYGFSRHRFPFVALLIVWSAYALIHWEELRGILRKGARSWRKTVIFAGWGFLIFSWAVEILVDAGALIGLKFVYPGY